MPLGRTWNKGNPYPPNPEGGPPSPFPESCSLRNAVIPHPPKRGSPFCVLHPTPSPLTAFPQRSSQRSPFHTPQHHGAMGDPPQVSALRPDPRVTPRDSGHPWALGTVLMHGEAWKSQNRGMLVPQPGWPVWSPSATLGQIPRGFACHDSETEDFVITEEVLG